ncbi:MAG: excinuclease ABC subunit A [Candidatus Melainabacteria bacterium GWF2_37_15]|nr:MAG: excinuclease ABC subunit A [Candidatus Melainabacteria bacterium GWF2_37_15]
MKNEHIIVRGANQHNLKNVSVSIPKDQLVVFTGVSGSGKSSLAFDTIFAEGQRRYIESLSAYARQFLGQLDKPDVESIEGLSPAISIDQKSTSNNPRSTVGTVTEIYDHLRLLFARIGTPHCPECGRVISPQTIDQIVNSILSLGEGKRIQILSPLVRGRKGEYSGLFSELRQEGFIRVRVDKKVYNLDEDDIKLAKTHKHDIEAILDRVIVKDSARSRIAESTQAALKKSEGLVIVDIIDEKEIIFSEKLSCGHCELSFDELSPRMFSFNSPYGACPTCSGLGAHMEISPDLVVPDERKSIRQGAIYPWAKTGNPYYQDILKSVAEHYSIDMDKPFEQLSEEHKSLILYGSNGDRLLLTHDDFKRRFKKSYKSRYEGVIPYFRRRYEESSSDKVREEIEKYMDFIPCHACHSTRLKPFSLAVKIQDKSIADVCNMSINSAYEYISSLFLSLSEYQMAIVKKLLEEIRNRLKFLVDVGLNYLSLDRMAGTLSGGEAQRIRLATQIGSGLAGVLYVLDEPSIGLHQVNNEQLLNTLLKLRNLGNTLIVVEHDEEIIRKADWVIDIGPRAGVHGGEIVAQGRPEDIEEVKESITGQYLRGAKSIKSSEKRRNGKDTSINIVNAHKNNLKNLDVNIPLGKFVSITGVSGSGKSSLIFDILQPYIKHHLGHNHPKPQGVREIHGLEHIDKIIDIDQAPIGRTPRSNPATYTGTFDHIRELFSMTNEAKTRGYQQGRFSFNVKGGRCEACRGDGIIKIEMNFLPDVYVPCEVCKGARYNRETLEVKYKGKSISDVLNMTVEEAYEFFKHIPKIASRLQTLHEVGLDYIKLGQSATTLSGGEAQRVKLASELNRRSTGRTLYLLDEPSVGLHWHDLSKLVEILNKLVDSGNTVVIIEHNMDIIKVSDWVIDLGPQGGDAGGEIVVQGTPEQIAACERSYTGKYLQKVLEKQTSVR